ncbi:leucine-rich repeat-containing protein 15-like [Lutzomyia longipalpis]|uniref:leucine-rich repeat-containing protein 15-like n=1 Tax=Lutzomyia longipalpis TaxID=7200 RepID=UPI002483C2A9|nr:leucine-rich repeat-containing protein 15-like [Lutzomyia longipalpis]XP_055676840.1 leucine-rich repeat-containing protein 15-like [Lutzomyia longipalpis]
MLHEIILFAAVFCPLTVYTISPIRPDVREELEKIQKEHFVHENDFSGTYMDFVPKALRWELAFILSFELRVNALDANGLKIIQQAFGLDDGSTVIMKRNLTNLEGKSLPLNGREINVTTLDLSENQIDEIDKDAFGGFINLHRLYLDHNRLSHMAVGVFNPLMKLKYLSLHSNNLQSIDTMRFPENSSLEELFLINNHITNLPEGSFENLRKLNNLHLSRNHLQILHEDAFRGLSSLKHLMLRENCIKHLPRGIFRELGELSHLDLEHNLMEFIDSEIFVGNEKLFSVLLSENRLTTLHPDTLVHLKKLETVMLDSNQLVEYNFSDLHTRTIRLTDNHLTELQFNPNATHIKAQGNKIERILVPSTVNLIDLQVDSNKIEDLGNITTISTLTALYIANNSISDLPEDFHKLTRLSALDLSHNHLTHLSFSSWTTNFSLTSLYDLRINGNNFSHLPTNFLDFFPNLQYLYICKNPWNATFLHSFSEQCIGRNITLNNPNDPTNDCSN